MRDPVRDAHIEYTGVRPDLDKPLQVTKSIYLAASWKNEHYPVVLNALRDAGYEVYDFRQEGSAFSWQQIDPTYATWSIYQYLQALDDERSTQGFENDMNALANADTCVMVLQSGRSAHLELGWAAGAGKRTFVLCLDPATEPELMYLMCTHICTSVAELLRRLRNG